jgi:hypothetical protein
VSTKALTRAELVQQAFDCCKQCVLAYGPADLSDETRTNLTNTMEHFKQLALRDVAKENDK